MGLFGSKILNAVLEKANDLIDRGYSSDQMKTFLDKNVSERAGGTFSRICTTVENETIFDICETVDKYGWIQLTDYKGNRVMVLKEDRKEIQDV